MPNRYSAEKRTLGEVLSLTSPAISVPEWQRNFSWDTPQVEIFLEDILGFGAQYPGENIRDQEYFLGSIVMVETPDGYVLLDGQQRIATTTILLSVIRDYLAEYRQDAAVRVAQKYIVEEDDATGTNSYKLTLNRYDRDFFRQEVQELPAAPAAAPQATLLSHRLIRKARLFFKQRFEAKYADLGRGRAAYEWALWVRRILTDHVSIVAVTSNDEDNAASAFEVLNDRGIGLSTPDLLRNLLLRRAAEPDREEIIQAWQDLLSLEEVASLEDFLRHYWVSRVGDIKTRRLYREIKQFVVANNTDSLSFSRELRNEASRYRDLVTAHDNDPEVRDYLEGIHQLGAKSLLPAGLSLYSVTDDISLKRRFLKGLVTLFVRHGAIGNLESTRLEAVVFELARQLRRDGDVTQALRRIREFSPTDEQFLEAFRSASVARAATARHILRELEHAARTHRELRVDDIPQRVNLEHIYPQSPPADRRVERHHEIVNRLGNLALLARRLNDAGRNAPFAEKKQVYRESELVLTNELVEYDNWDEASIHDRQQRMGRLALEVWPLPG